MTFLVLQLFASASGQWQTLTFLSCHYAGAGVCSYPYPHPCFGAEPRSSPSPRRNRAGPRRRCLQQARAPRGGTRLHPRSPLPGDRTVGRPCVTVPPGGVSRPPLDHAVRELSCQLCPAVGVIAGSMRLPVRRDSRGWLSSKGGPLTVHHRVPRKTLVQKPRHGRLPERHDPCTRSPGLPGARRSVRDLPRDLTPQLWQRPSLNIRLPDMAATKFCGRGWGRRGRASRGGRRWDGR